MCYHEILKEYLHKFKPHVYEYINELNRCNSLDFEHHVVAKKMLECILIAEKLHKIESDWEHEEKEHHHEEEHLEYATTISRQ